MFKVGYSQVFEQVWNNQDASIVDDNLYVGCFLGGSHNRDRHRKIKLDGNNLLETRSQPVVLQSQYYGWQNTRSLHCHFQWWTWQPRAKEIYIFITLLLFHSKYSILINKNSDCWLCPLAKLLLQNWSLYPWCLPRSWWFTHSTIVFYKFIWKIPYRILKLYIQQLSTWHFSVNR